MKLTSLLVFACLMQVSAAIYGQQITIKERNGSLEKILREIRKQSGYDIIYELSLLDQAKPVDIDVQNATLADALAKCFASQPLTFSIQGKTVTVTRKEAPATGIFGSTVVQSTIEVRGKVTDDLGKAMSGVTVQVSATNVRTVTAADGTFTLRNVDPRAELVFSYLSYQTQRLPAGPEMGTIRMQVAIDELEAVVVTGIFDRRSESFTGAATVIQKEEIMRGGSINLLQSISNIDPSLRILENLEFGSDPNRMPDIQMRGQQSIPDIKGAYTGNPNQPLFVLDGFEADVSTVFDLDMNRVETVVLLKDAAAKAIYGARGANGVIVIETRKPQSGRLRVSYKADVNITEPDLTGYNLTNAMEKYVVERDNPSQHEYYFFFEEQYLNNIRDQIARGVDTYWLSQPLATGVGQRHSVYLEGGDDHIQYGVDLLYNNVAGIMKGSGRNTLTGGFNLSYRRDKLLFRNQFHVSQNQAHDSPYGSFSAYTTLNPYWSPYDDMGNLKQVVGTVGGGGWVETRYGNPLWNAQINTKNLSRYTSLTNNFYVEWHALQSLKLTGRLGVTKNHQVREDFFPASHTRFANYGEDRFFERGSYDKMNGESNSIRADLNAHYSLLLGKHHFFFNGGLNIQENSADNVGFSVIGFPSDRMEFIASGREFLPNSRPSGAESISREAGVLSAMNYSYDERYLADLSYRATGSSMFGLDSRWGHFWSAGIGWNLHREHFLAHASSWLRQFKLRASTGYTGSQNFNPYQALATFGYYQTQAYDQWVGSYLLSLPNDDLKWQMTQDYNIGFDLNLWGRISARYDYYVQSTKDQLLDFTIPPSMGFTTYKENLGNTQNKGMELKLGAQLLAQTTHDRFLSVSLAIARNSNRITKISNALQSFNDANDDQLASGTSAETRRPLRRYVEGQSMNAIWAVRSLGIDPATGDEIFLTRDDRLTTAWNVEDQVVTGDAMPKFIGNFGLNTEFKRVFLNLSFNYQWGGQIYNQTLVDRVENANVAMNVDRRIYDATWSKPNDHVAFSFNHFKTTKPSSRFVQDLNELRLSVLQAGYDFKRTQFLARTGLEQLRLSFFMNDVFRVSSVQIERGLDYPFARTYSISIQGSF